MIAHAEEHFDLCAGHVLRSLHEGEERKWREHVASGCPECGIALDSFGAAALAVARGTPLSPPPASLRAKVLSDALLASASAAERTRERGASGPSVRIGVGFTGWLAIYAIAAIVAVAIYFNLQIQKLKADNAGLRHQITRVSATMVDAARWEPAVAGPDARILALRPLHNGPAARATVFFDPQSRRAVIAASEMPSLPGGRLIAWAIGEGSAVPLGVLSPDRGGNAILRAEPPPAATVIRGFAISREPVAAAFPGVPSDVLLQARVTN